MRRVRCLLARDDGLSMVEMLIASAVSLVILASTLQLLDSGVRAERGQDARHQALVELRGAMGRVSKELRQAVSIDPSSTPARLDVQTLVGGVERHAVYELSNGELNRYLDGGNPVPVAGHVTTLEPFCYDPPDCRLDSPPAIPTSFGISLTVDPTASSSEPITLETEVELRNL